MDRRGIDIENVFANVGIGSIEQGNTLVIISKILKDDSGGSHYIGVFAIDGIDITIKKSSAHGPQILSHFKGGINSKNASTLLSLRHVLIIGIDKFTASDSYAIDSPHRNLRHPSMRI